MCARCVSLCVCAVICQYISFNYGKDWRIAEALDTSESRKEKRPILLLVFGDIYIYQIEEKRTKDYILQSKRFAGLGGGGGWAEEGDIK